MAATSPRARSSSVGNVPTSLTDKLGVLRGHTDAVTSIVLNGNQLVSASEDKTVRFWDIKDLKLGRTIGPFDSHVMWLGMMPRPSIEESKYLYMAMPNKWVRYDVLEGVVVKETRFPLAVADLVFRSAAFNPPNQLIIGLNDGTIATYDVWNGTILSKTSQKAHSAAVTSLQVDSFTSTLVSISDDRSLKLWPADNATAPTRSLDLNSFHFGYLQPLSLALAGGFIFVGLRDKEILMFSLQNLLAGGNDILARFSGHSTSVTSIRVLEGTLIAASGDILTLWSVSDKSRIAVVEPNQSWNTALEITGSRLFSAGTDASIHIYRYQTKVMNVIKEGVRKKDKDIDLSCCQLSDFPTILHFAKWATNLNLAHNAFSSLSAELSVLSSLTSLSLSHNHLDSLPTEFEALQNLITLNLDHNKFRMIPLPLAGLPGLRRLNIADNQLTFIFPFLSKLSLTALDVSGNPLEDPPMDIVKSGGLPAIMDYLKAKNSLYVTPVNRVKLMLVGNENVGKTSLVLNLRHKASLFSARPNIKTLSTQGISIETVQANLKQPLGVPVVSSSSSNTSAPSLLASSSTPSSPSTPKDPKLAMSVTSVTPDKKKLKRKVKWYTWDFGGQDIYYHTHQFFITPHSIYIIAFNVTKPLDDNNILFWLRCIQARTSTSRGSHSYSGDSTANKSPVPVILVATHTDSFDKTQLPWLQNLFLDNSKEKIALLTKKDEAFLDVYYSWIYKRFSAEHPSVRLVTGVSSKTGKGVKELKQALRSVIDSAPAIRNQVNANVYERVFLFEQMILKAKVAKVPPFLTWQEYQTMASGILDDQTALLEATKLLANLGSLVYLPSSSRKNSWMVSMAQLFPEDYDSPPQSAEFVVLDPQWLVDLFATILGTSPNFVRNGMIRSQDLPLIWKDHSKYPPAMHNQLMLMLEHFDVAFSLGSRRKHAVEHNPVVSGLPAPKLKDIVRGNIPKAGLLSKGSSSALVSNEAPTHLFPSLLPSGKPNLDILWPKFEHRFQVDRIYSFPRFLPLGLFSRFMVRLLSYFPAFFYWRQGVIISDDTKRAYALIEELASSKQVTITVRGPVNAVSQFLGSVMDIWGKLVTDMYDIHITMTTTCYHCTANRVENPHIFELSVCEMLVASGERFCPCNNGGVVRLDQLCPDLCLVNIRELEIDPRDLLPFSNDAPDGGLIGEGGFGMVFRKTYKGKLVAVKKFKDIEKKGLEPAELAKIHTSFRNEIWLMSGASHPNIVKLLGFSLRRESIMVMEYISGGDLYEALIGDRKLSWPLRYRIALDIARGMAALHALNPPLCHSDLKCPNCMIVDWNAEAAVVAKVSDFGLSSRLYGDQLTKTPTMNPFWTAPEILAELPFDTSADVYSFGVILWNLLSRKALFEEMLPWTDEVSKAVRSGKRPTIPKVPGMLPEYEALIKKCWDHKPAERPKFPQICLDIETMIAKHCPELMPVVEKTRAEMMSATQEHHHDMIRNSMLHSSQGSPSSSLRSPLPASLSSLMLHSHSITNTWNQVPNAPSSSGNGSTTSSQQHKARFSIITDTSIAPTYYNNSKLADYGTMLLKQIPAGCVVTLMTTVGLSQVWAYSAAMGLMYVINSVSGQFVKSFVAPKDLECLIEVNFQEGSSEVWAGGAGGLFIWHGETAQPLPHMMSSEPIKSLLYIYKPDRRGVVWAGLTKSPKIQIWSAAIRDLLRTATLPAEPDTPETDQVIKPASAPTSPNVALGNKVVLSPKSSSTSIVSGGPVVAMVRCGHVVWVACGPFLTQLNANSGAPEGREVEDSALLEPLLTSSASSSSSSSTDVKPKTSCISAHVGGIKSMVYSRLGKIWTSGADGNMKIWDSTTGALIKTVQNYTPTQLLVVDRTQVWASQPAGTSIDTWNMESCEMVNRVETEHKSPVTRTLLVFNKTVWTAGQDEAIHVFT